jgi:hypothetical protein
MLRAAKAVSNSNDRRASCALGSVEQGLWLWSVDQVSDDILGRAIEDYRAIDESHQDAVGS